MVERRREIARAAAWISGAAIGVLLVLAALAVFGVEREHTRASASARAQLRALTDAEHLHRLLSQRGFVALYFLTGEESWIDALAQERAPFRTWLDEVDRTTRAQPARDTVSALQREYAVYDSERDRSIRTFREGRREEAIQLDVENRSRATRLRDLAASLIEIRRAELTEDMARADGSFRRSVLLLAVFLAAAIGAAALIGFLFAKHVESSSRELAEQRARVAQAEKMSALGEMATAIAHEVLNPLAGIKIALQLLSRLESSPTISETVSAADREIARVDRIARRLIAFARPLQPSLRACDLRELLARVLDSVKGDPTAKQVEITLDAPQGAAISADPDLLEQILVNLTLNACQAIAGPGHVRLRAGRADGYRTIEVVDDGPGIASDIAPKLFTPFVTNKPEGHGLGLALSQTIALAHGGRIEARSNAPVRGATFTVYLPEAA